MADISLREKPFLAHWAPGAILTVLALFYLSDANGVRIFWVFSSHVQSTTLLIVIGALLSFGLGQVLDAIRDSFEDVFDWGGRTLRPGRRVTSVLYWLGFVEVNWRFLVTGDQHHLDNLEAWYYSHYMLTFNLGLGTILLVLLPWHGIIPSLHVDMPCVPRLLLVIVGIVLLYDAVRLRSGFADLTNTLGAGS